MVPWPLMMTTSGRVSGGSCAHVGEHFEAVAVGQPDVEQNHVVGRVAAAAPAPRRQWPRWPRRSPLRAGSLRARCESPLRRRPPGCDSSRQCLLSAVSALGFERGCGLRATGSISGRRSRKRAPLGLLASALMEPPCSCTILAAMERPRPVPRCLVE